MIGLPPRDENGTLIPHDHQEIEDNFELIRRISDQQIVTDATGRRIASSLAYKASSGANGGMSVDVKDLIEGDRKDPKIYVTTPKWIGSVLFKVSDLRKLGFKVGYDPIPEPAANPYHGQVWGTFSKDKRDSSGQTTERGTISELQALAVWFVPIENVSLT
jgi:hypothetical protein